MILEKVMRLSDPFVWVLQLQLCIICSFFVKILFLTVVWFLDFFSSELRSVSTNMSNTLGHNILQQSLLRPPLLEPQRKLNSSGIPANTLFQAVCGNQSAAHSRKSPLSRKFFGNNLSVQKSKLASGTRCPVTVVPRAVLAMDPASEVIIHLLKMVAYPFCFKMLNV